MVFTSSNVVDQSSMNMQRCCNIGYIATLHYAESSM